MLMACNDTQMPVSPDSSVEIDDISYLESDDDPADVDAADSPDANARLASTSSLFYFQAKSDDGEKYLKEFEIEDYYYGNTPPPNTPKPTPTNLRGALKYSLISPKGTNYIKSKALKYGYHRLVIKTNGVAWDEYAEVQSEPGQKRVVQFGVTSGGQGANYPVEYTRLVRLSFDATIKKRYDEFYNVLGKSNPDNVAFPVYVMQNGENLDNMEADWGFMAEPETGKSCAIRVIGNEYQKMLIWGETITNKPVGRAVDLTAKKGVSFKFKPKKKGY